MLPLAVLGPVWLLVTSLGNCAPEYGCHRNHGWDMPVMPATLGSIGALLGFSVRALVNWLARRVRDPAGLLAAAALPDWWLDRSWL